VCKKQRENNAAYVHNKIKNLLFNIEKNKSRLKTYNTQNKKKYHIVGTIPKSVIKRQY
jgi:hypothetical protein